MGHRCRTPEHGRRRVLRLEHFVVGMERGHMPRDIDRHARDKCRQSLQLVFGIVEAWNEQRHELEPEALLMKAPDRVEDRLQASTELAIVTIVEAFEIDL